MAHQIRKTTSHIRSSSWPTTSSHPLDSSVEALLQKLKLTTSDLESSSSSSSSKTICNNLNDIKSLYEEINNLVQSSMNQKVISIEEHKISMENVLEGSLALLDASSSIIDVLSLMKESIVQLQSCVQRKGGEQAKGIDSYMMSRKKIQKLANKCLKNLQKINLVKDVSNNNNATIVRMLREAEIVSFSTLKSVLAYFSETTNKGKSWSLMTTLMNSKHGSCEKETYANEIVKMDDAIIGFEAKKTSIDVKIMNQDLLKQLAALELSVQDIEGSLESISRCFLRTRVSLLNIISQ